MDHLKLNLNSWFVSGKWALPRQHAMHHFNTLSRQLFWCFTNHILKKGPITLSCHAPLSRHTPITVLFHILHSEKRTNHAITPIAGAPLNSKIQVYAHHTFKCLYAMQIIRFMYVCRNLFHLQIKIYKQNSVKLNYNINTEYNPNRHLPI